MDAQPVFVCFWQGLGRKMVNKPSIRFVVIVIGNWCVQASQGHDGAGHGPKAYQLAQSAVRILRFVLCHQICANEICVIQPIRCRMAPHAPKRDTHPPAYPIIIIIMHTLWHTVVMARSWKGLLLELQLWETWIDMSLWNTFWSVGESFSMSGHMEFLHTPYFEARGVGIRMQAMLRF